MRALNRPNEVNDVVVTGSPTTNGNDSPLTVVQTQDVLDMEPGLLTDTLTEVPALANSKTTAAVTENGATTGGNSNSDQLNLRKSACTVHRSLVDGLRQQRCGLLHGRYDPELRTWVHALGPALLDFNITSLFDKLRQDGPTRGTPDAWHCVMDGTMATIRSVAFEIKIQY